MSKWAFVLAGVLPLLADPSPARADPTTAEALFREGRQLLDAGKYQAACLKLAESQRQDPASGTLINLALCYELDGKLATAWALYRSTASLARQDGRPDRQQSAEQKAAALETRVPRLILHMEHLPARGLLIQGPNGPLGAGALGSPIPVDPGSYRVTVSAPGYRDWSAELVIHEAESPTLEIPALEPDAPASRAATRSAQLARAGRSAERGGTQLGGLRGWHVFRDCVAVRLLPSRRPLSDPPRLQPRGAVRA